MRIERTPKQIPDGAPSSSPAGQLAKEEERFVWEVLAPRLLDPSKLAFIQALLEDGRPLTLGQLAGAADIAEEHARYQCRSMLEAGVLEVVGVVPQAGGEEEEPAYFFPQAISSESGADGHQRMNRRYELR